MKKGSAQDATFITSDPGHVKHDKTRRSKDGSFTKKNNKTALDIRNTPLLMTTFLFQ